MPSIAAIAVTKASSPKALKVETLGTNPTGKIYPVITHARNTDVHLQLTHLARQVYLDYLEQGPGRLTELASERFEHEEQLHHQYRERRTRLQTTCLCCGKELDPTNIWPNAYFLEDADGLLSGFAEDECFFQLLLQDCYPELSGREHQNLLRELLNQSSHNDHLLLHKPQGDSEKTQATIFRLDREGNKLAGRNIDIKESGLFQRRSKTGLAELFRKAAPDNHNDATTLLARRMGESPLDILNHRPYLEWQTVFNRALVDLHNDQQDTSSFQ